MSGRKRHKKAEHENAERWLLTYADMITLLVAFFMMMYSMSVLNLEKFKQAAIGIRSGFNGQTLQDKPSGESIIEKGSAAPVVPDVPVLVPPTARAAERGERSELRAAPRRPEGPSPRAQRIGALTARIQERLSAVTGARSVTKVLPENKGVAIELVGEMIFFPRGSSELSEEAKRILAAVATVLREVPNEISAEGHANAAPDAGAFGSWELSTARATKVIKFLLQTGRLDPKRVSVTGYGEYRPVVSRTKSTEQVARNDLVRIFIYQD